MFCIFPFGKICIFCFNQRPEFLRTSRASSKSRSTIPACGQVLPSDCPASGTPVGVAVHDRAAQAPRTEHLDLLRGARPRVSLSNSAVSLLRERTGCVRCRRRARSRASQDRLRFGALHCSCALGPRAKAAATALCDAAGGDGETAAPAICGTRTIVVSSPCAPTSMPSATASARLDAARLQEPTRRPGRRRPSGFRRSNTFPGLPAPGRVGSLCLTASYGRPAPSGTSTRCW